MIVSNADAAAIAKRRFCLLKKIQLEMWNSWKWSVCWSKCNPIDQTTPMVNFQLLPWVMSLFSLWGAQGRHGSSLDSTTKCHWHLTWILYPNWLDLRGVTFPNEYVSTFIHHHKQDAHKRNSILMGFPPNPLIMPPSLKGPVYAPCLSQSSGHLYLTPFDHSLLDLRFDSWLDKSGCFLSNVATVSLLCSIIIIIIMLFIIISIRIRIIIRNI